MTHRPTVNPKKMRPYDVPPKRRRSLIPDAPDSAATGFLVAAAFWLALVGGLGALAIGMRMFAFEYLQPLGLFDLAIDVDGVRVDYAFVNASVYGWLSNAAFAAIAFMTPRLLGRRLALERLLMVALAIWNLSLLGGIASLFVFELRPHAPLTAMFWLFDGGLALGALIVTAAFLLTAATSLRSAYVSTWFAGVALLGLVGLTGLDALVGVIGVFVTLPELAIALGSVYVERAIPTMWLLGTTFAILHYVVPRAVGLPLASGGLGILAFLTWLALAPVAGLGELLDASIPYAITSIGQVATMLLLVPVALTVVNLVLSMQGRWSLLFGAGTASLALVSMAFLLATALLAAIGALRSVHLFVDGTDWELGLFLWTVFGGFTFAALSMAHHALPRILQRAWRGSFLTGAQLWLIFGGTVIAGLALMGGGMAEASLLTQGSAADAVGAGVLPYRLLAFASFGLVALGGLAHLVNLFLMYTTAAPADYAVPGQAATAAAGH